MSGLEKIYCSVPTQKSFLPSVMFPNSTVFFHTTLNSPTQLSAPCRATQEKCRSTSLKKFTRKCSKLARDAAQRLQNYPPFCQSATGKIRTALSPGALYPHPVPKQNAQKCLDGRVWWVLIEQSRPKIFGNFTRISNKFKYSTKLLQNYRRLKNGLEKAVLPLFPMLFSQKSGTPNTPRNQTPSLNCGKTTKNFSSKSHNSN